MAYGTINADLMTTSDGVSSSGLYGFKNRIINGAMVISQRNGTSATTINNNSAWVYTLDRWSAIGQPTDGVFTVTQSTTAPTGFNNSAVITITTADASIGATQDYLFRQPIEGYNVADLGWGTANAKTVTLSFWVQSSVTGTFSGSLRNGAADRSYAFNYSIPTANTWQQVSITIAGDTTGTWLTTNGNGLEINFAIGAGSSKLTTANTWTAGNYDGVTGQTNLIATNGATFYITGVQLEKGSTATSFDYRPYSLEFSMCQRYYQKVTAGVSDRGISTGYYYLSTSMYAQIPFQTYMRAAPTLDINSGTNYFILYSNGAGDGVDTMSLNDATPYTAAVFNGTQASGTSGSAGQFKTNNASAYLAFTAEL